MGVGKVLSSESFKAFGQLSVEDLSNHLNSLMKSLDAVVGSFIFRSDLIRA